MKRFLVVLVIVLVFPVIALAAAPMTRADVLFNGIGRFTPQATVTKTWGIAHYQEKMIDNTTSKLYGGIRVYYNRFLEVRALDISARDVLTARGIGVGDDKDDVFRMYGEPVQTQMNVNTLELLITYRLTNEKPDPAGITFLTFVMKNRKIKNIIVDGTIDERINPFVRIHGVMQPKTGYRDYDTQNE